MAHLRRGRNGERGQIMILFALMIVVIMAFAAIVIDAGLLRTDSQRLWNAIDAGALAGAHQLPAISPSNTTTPGTVYSSVTTKAQQFVTTNYPGVGAPSITYVCFIGQNTTTGLPQVVDMPTVCNVSFAASDSHWRCAGGRCWAPCDPGSVSTDVCNTIVVSDSATQAYTFGRAVGVNNGSTGTLTSAACTGWCGSPPTAPLDLALMIDRTGSMSGDQANLVAGAQAVLKLYNPAIQRVALGMLGPSSQFDTCSGSPAVKGVPLVPATPAVVWMSRQTNVTASGGASSLGITKPTSTASGDLLIAGIVVSGGTGTAITAPAGWTLLNRSDNAASVSIASYYRIAGGSESATYTFNFSPNAKAAGSISRYTGEDTAHPIDVLGADASGNGTSVQGASINTTVDHDQVVGFFGTIAAATFTVPGGMTERADVRVSSSVGPAIETADYTLATAGSTGNKAATASTGGAWVGHLVALQPAAVDTYGTAYPADLSKWIPVGFTGTDGDTPPVAYNEAYSTAGTLNASSHIVQGITCITNEPLSGTGTNLATPMYMASQYLQHYGRGGSVRQGIIFETDGTPNLNGVGTPSDYTCSQAVANATAAKAAGIVIFTIGYGDVAAANCPDTSGAYHNVRAIKALADMASTRAGTDTCTAAENSDGDDFFCQPSGSDLASVFAAAATSLAAGPHLVQLYPQPIVTGVSPSGGPKTGGTSVTISGKYFTDAYSVTFSGTPASSFSVLSDTSIVATAPAGGAGTTVDIRVSTAGGSSSVVSADHYTYGP